VTWIASPDFRLQMINNQLFWKVQRNWKNIRKSKKTSRKANKIAFAV